MSAASDFDRAILDFMQDDPLAVTYVSSLPAVFNPATGENTATDISTQVSAIILDLTSTSSGLSSKFGTQIVAGDKEIYILPPEKSDPFKLPLVVNPANDLIKVGIVEYSVVAMKECNPTASAPLLYNFHIRR